MDRLTTSCLISGDYPRNLVYPGTYAYNLKSYVAKLDEKQSNLFCDESSAEVDFLELETQEEGFRPGQVKSEDGMKSKLRFANPNGLTDPRCRFIFFHAAHSRAALKTTRLMLMSALTYHQVMPAYLDFVFPFGDQIYAEDFHFSGFRAETRLNETARGLQIPKLGRSGRFIQLCYSLKSVEPSKETGRTVWIMVKGNNLMKKRIMSATAPASDPDLTSFQTPGCSFASSLAAHAILCDWAGENWRWYINFLEKSLQSIARKTLHANIERPPSPMKEKLAHPSTMPIKKRPSMASQIAGSAVPGVRRVFSLLVDKSKNIAQPNAVPLAGDQNLRRVDPEEFSFDDLQALESLEEKTNETLMIMKINAKILSQLEQHYKMIMESEDTPGEIRENCKGAISMFFRNISNVTNDLQMQQSRLETLLHLLANRKTLLYGIINYQNMEASKHLAEKAHESAHEMHKITQEMNTIAKKTEQETVSMRIITLVTLFFLPGTFVSTLFSTDVIKFPTSDSGENMKVFSSSAMELWFAITIPMMVVTFLAWGGYYKYVHNKQGQKWKPESPV